VAVEAGAAAVVAAAAAPAGAVTAAAASAAGAAAAAAAAPVAAGAGLAVATFYVGKYFYKRFTWNNEAKEKEFKSQFVAHVTKKKQLIVGSASANCSKQVEQ